MASPRLIGNDIVDLRLPGCESKHLDSRFMARVFSPRERKLILASACPSQLLWQFWAAKEAAFKLLQRQSPELIFAHALFEVWSEGRVQYAEQSLDVGWEWGPGWVHAVCLSKGEEGWKSRVAEKSAILPVAERMTWSAAEKESIHSQESLATRGLAKEVLREMGVPSAEVVRPRLASGALGPPGFRSVEKISLSLSHDGDWIAVALSRHGV